MQFTDQHISLLIGYSLPCFEMASLRARNAAEPGREHEGVFNPE